MDALHVVARAYPGLKLPGPEKLGQLCRRQAAAQEAANLPTQAEPILWPSKTLRLASAGCV